jgi:hypothetical protein
MIDSVLHPAGIHPAAAKWTFASSRNSGSGTTNSVFPQSKQTNICGKMNTCGLLIFLSPGKWMAISAMNLRWLSGPHDLHVIVALFQSRIAG